MASAEVLGERIPLVVTSLENDIGTVTLNNSKKHNALSAALIADLLEAGIKLNASGAKVVILRAAPGVKVWSAGHDVKELPTNGRDPLTYDDPLRQVVRAIHETRMPVIAMIEGSVWGGACEVVMACDIVVAAEGASFAITPAKLGVPYDIVGVLTFMQNAGLGILKEMLFTAQPISAQRAVQVGLVNQVVPGDRLEEATMTLAAQIARNSPLVVSLLKEQLRVLSESTPLNPNTFERIVVAPPNLRQRRLPRGNPLLLRAAPAPISWKVRHADQRVYNPEGGGVADFRRCDGGRRQPFAGRPDDRK